MKDLVMGIDIGGTFTDIIIQNRLTGEILKQVKISTTPKEPDKAILNYLTSKLNEDEKEDVKQIYHATTIATNAFLGQVILELPNTALITTKGFRDILEIGRQRRALLYDLKFERPKPIISRKFRFEVEERIDCKGEILKPLKFKDLETISEIIAEEQICSLAICLLHSYKNIQHEQQIMQFFKEKFPELYVSASFEISPEHREYERTSTTAINAILMPIVSRYIYSLTDSFSKIGIKSPLFIMQSNGGVSHASQIQKLPVSIIESGPSAGVVASRFLAEFLDEPLVLSFDMGGTTAKAGSIVDKTIVLTSEYEIGGEVHSGRITKGSGYPARFPFIDLAEISSGGGSIAWVDDGYALRVGPLSAGADPGPACYGLKGIKPTITDASLVLGRLNPVGLLDNTFKIYPDLAVESIKKEISEKLSLDLVESAIGIVKIANNNMSRILRIVTIERGLDPRDFKLIAFGGAGPLHAAALAKELDIKEIIIPPNPGLFSAMGLLYTDVKHTFVRSIRNLLSVVEFSSIENGFLELEKEGATILQEEGFVNQKQSHQRYADLRYSGQGFELQIPITGIKLTNKNVSSQISSLFDKKHESIYGYTMNEEIELVNIRVNSFGMIKKPTISKITTGKKAPTAESLSSSREVFFDGFRNSLQTSIFNRNKLLANNQIFGPAIIEQYDTTTVIPPEWFANIDEYGFIHLRRK